MWIQTQNKQRIINSDQIVSIFISYKGTTIFAQTTAIVSGKECELIALGEYKDKETCLKVLERLQRNSLRLFEWDNMPLDDKVNEWLQDEEI